MFTADEVFEHGREDVWKSPEEICAGGFLCRVVDELTVDDAVYVAHLNLVFLFGGRVAPAVAVVEIFNVVASCAHVF